MVVIRKKQTVLNEQRLEKEIDQLYAQVCEGVQQEQVNTLQGQLEVKKDELQQIRAQKMRAARLRSRVKYYEEGEKPTKYFLNLEKRNYISKTITRLVVDDKEILDQSDILEAQKNFYKKLYSENSHNNDENYDFFLNERCVNELNETQKEACEGMINEKEVKEVLKNMSNNKSPGSDGYTTEFYKFFFVDLGHFLIRSLKHAFNSGKLSITQRQGVITCIPKGNKSRHELKNWRPISLLNIDYKILTGVLAARLKGVLGQVIGDEQKGFLKERFIGENTRLVYDIILEMKARCKPGLLLLIDFEKAFDCVRWEYVRKTLSAYNFGEDFRKWFNILYNDAQSTVINNGHFSQFFNLERGCRQGDPLSPYIFLLAVEPLAMAIKQDENIRGLNFGSKEHKLGQYADDMFLLLDGSRESLENSFDTLNKFQYCSGLKINVEKTNAIWLGSKTNSKDTVSNRIRLKWVKEFTLLGINFHSDINKIMDLNYNVALGKLENVLKLYEHTSLSLIGRVTVLKSLAIPVLVHVLQVLPTPSLYYIEQYNKIVRKFLWKGGKPRICLSQLRQSYEKGGLKLTDFQMLNDALKISWLKRLMVSDGGWQKMFTDCICKEKSLIWELDTVSLEKFGRTILNPFWRDVIIAWRRFSSMESNECFLKYPLWNSSFITNCNLNSRKSEFMGKGIIYVNDLVSENNGFISRIELEEKYEIRMNFLDYNSLILSIPQAWRKEVNSGKRKIENVENVMLKKITKSKRVCKFVYDLLVDKKEVERKTHEKWSKALNIQMDEERWRMCFIDANKSIISAVLRSFQYHIIHRSLVTNKFLFMCNIKDSDICYYCEQHCESIEHLFWDCECIQNIWDGIVKEFKGDFNIQQYVKKEYVLLGVETALNKTLINHIFIVVKRYIYIIKCTKRKLSIQGVLRYIKSEYEIEKQIAVSSDKVKLLKKWEPLNGFLT